MKNILSALCVSLLIAGGARAALIFTFADGGDGTTTITVSGDTATAVGSTTVSSSLIGYRGDGAGADRNGGFTTRADTFDFVVGGYSTFAALGSGSLTDTITLASTGMVGTDTLISGFEFSASRFALVMNSDVALRDATLSRVGATDVTGIMAVDYSAFSSLHGQTLLPTGSADGWEFKFEAVPEPAAIGMVAMVSIGTLFIRRRLQMG
jgi:hypothetical protein